MTCPLCHSQGDTFYDNERQAFYKCPNCLGLYIDPSKILGKEAERLRYEKHRNDPEDLKYQQFVSPIVSSILVDFKTWHKGLDFGSGGGSAVSKLLKDHRFQIDSYDPYFFNTPELLKKQYDYVACCEVMEHFQNPDREFELLKRLLQPGGRLYCMTSIYDESIDFKAWYYKNDPTHVFIYHRKTLEWIKAAFGFSMVQIVDGKLVIYSME